MNALALNAGSGSLRYKLFARREGDGPTTESLLKERSFDRIEGHATVEAADAAADGYGDGLDEAEREAVWLAAGIATFIGQAIADEPERFIVAAGDRRAG